MELNKSDQNTFETLIFNSDQLKHKILKNLRKYQKLCILCNKLNSGLNLGIIKYLELLKESN
jgi:hypothetical protein